MVFFRKRKKREEDIEEIKNVIEGKKISKKITENPKELEEKIPVEEQKPISEVIEKPKKPESAPLFIKIDRYKIVLNFINNLKNTIMALKNALEVQKQIEELKDENRKLLESAINKIDKQVLSLDSEFLRPKGYEQEVPPPIYETGELEGVVSDLRRQIEGLKSELKTIS